jgi:hypothetical protein
MISSRKLAFLPAIVISILLSGCGESGGGFWNEKTETDNGSTSSETETTTEETVAKQLGKIESGVFVAGELSLSATNIQAYGSALVSAAVYDVEGNIYTDPVSISFKSNCSLSQLASITSPVSTENGIAETSYTAIGCEGEDTITATATIDDEVQTATAVIDVEPAVIHSLRFESASPTQLFIRGLGQVEESIVQFRILDKEGRAVPNKEVAFSLGTVVGGVSLSDTLVTSDSSGVVKVAVHAGTKPTTVEVRATLVENQNIVATSDTLVISTGVADENSMTLAASVFNPEAWNIVNNEVQITAVAGDHANNPVPDGTQVYFTAEGGQIEPQCETQNGSCSVTWRSSAPYPCYGRASILAVMKGEESFTDSNSNGVFDNSERFDDMPEVFRDDNENGSYDTDSEEFWDFNQNDEYDLADGKYNGVLCQTSDDPDSLCSSEKNIYISRQLELIMAGSSARLEVFQETESGAELPLSNNTIVVTDNGAVVSVQMSGYLLRDELIGKCSPEHEDAGVHQPMPAGTTISFELKKGELLSEKTYTMGNTSIGGAVSYPIIIAAPTDAEPGDVSLLTIKIETPGGNGVEGKTTYSYVNLYFDVTAEEVTE